MEYTAKSLFEEYKRMEESERIIFSKMIADFDGVHTEKLSIAEDLASAGISIDWIEKNII